MPDETLALSLDIGTSSTRVMLWGSDGREVEGVKAQIQYAMHTTPDGGVEMPAEELLQHVGDALDQGLAQAGDRIKAVRVVGVSTFWHSVLGIDAQGNALTPIYNWSDTRAGDAAQKLRQQMPPLAVHARTGCVLHPSYYPAKLVWLRETQPDLFGSVARWVSPSEYLCGQFFGPQSLRVSLSIASGTGLLNQSQCEWDGETLKAMGLPVERLSPIVDLDAPFSGLAGAFANRWPALQSVPFVPAVGDGACGNVGSGCVSSDRFAINLGTSGAIRALWDERTLPGAAASPPTGLWRYRVDKNRPLIGAAFSDGGIVYAWLSKTLQLPPPDELEKQIAAMSPGEHGLAFLPFLSGERSIGWNPHASASLIGMNLDTGPIEILRAGMEAVALRFGLAAQILRGLFPQAREIVASGGALGHSPAWSQMFADALGQPVTLAGEPEASSRGAALLALQSLGLLPKEELPEARLGQTYQPDPARHAQFQQLLARQQAYYELLVDRKPPSLY